MVEHEDLETSDSESIGSEDSHTCEDYQAFVEAYSDTPKLKEAIGLNTYLCIFSLLVGSEN